MRVSGALKVQVNNNTPFIMSFTDHYIESNTGDWVFNIQYNQGSVASLLMPFFVGDNGWDNFLPFVSQKDFSNTIIVGSVLDQYGNSEDFRSPEIDFVGFKQASVKLHIKNYLQLQVNRGIPLPFNSDVDYVINRIEATDVDNIQTLINANGLGSLINFVNEPITLTFLPLSSVELDSLDNNALDLVAAHEDAFFYMTNMVDAINSDLENNYDNVVSASGLGQRMIFSSNCYFEILPQQFNS